MTRSGQCWSSSQPVCPFPIMPSRICKCRSSILRLCSTVYRDWTPPRHPISIICRTISNISKQYNVDLAIHDITAEAVKFHDLPCGETTDAAFFQSPLLSPIFMHISQPIQKIIPPRRLSNKRRDRRDLCVPIVTDKIATLVTSLPISESSLTRLAC